MINRLILWIGISALLIAPSFACKFEGRAGNNQNDLKESQRLGEQYLENIKNQYYDAALESATDQLKSLVTPESLKTSMEGRLQGGSIQSWSLKAHQIVQGSHPSVHMLYEVQSTKGTDEMEITTELIPNPWRWQIASVKLINDDAAVENAKEADVIANEFLKQLQSGNFAKAYQLTSLLCQKNTPIEALIEYWKQLEQSKGAIKGWELKSFQDTTADFSGTRQHYTMLIYEVAGANGKGGAVLTMLKTERGWQIEGFKIIESL